MKNAVKSNFAPIPKAAGVSSVFRSCCGCHSVHLHTFKICCSSEFLLFRVMNVYLSVLMYVSCRYHSFEVFVGSAMLHFSICIVIDETRCEPITLSLFVLAYKFQHQLSRSSQNFWKSCLLFWVSRLQFCINRLSSVSLSFSLFLSLSLSLSLSFCLSLSMPHCFSIVWKENDICYLELRAIFSCFKFFLCSMLLLCVMVWKKVFCRKHLLDVFRRGRIRDQNCIYVCKSHSVIGAHLKALVTSQEFFGQNLLVSFGLSMIIVCTSELQSEVESFSSIVFALFPIG